MTGGPREVYKEDGPRPIPPPIAQARVMKKPHPMGADFSYMARKHKPLNKIFQILLVWVNCDKYISGLKVSGRFRAEDR